MRGKTPLYFISLVGYSVMDSELGTHKSHTKTKIDYKE